MPFKKRELVPEKNLHLAGGEVEKVTEVCLAREKREFLVFRKERGGFLGVAAPGGKNGSRNFSK